MIVWSETYPSTASVFDAAHCAYMYASAAKLGVLMCIMLLRVDYIM